MLQLMKYRLLAFIRDTNTMFWTFLFPLILCTLFYTSFGHVEDDIECIKTAMVIKSESSQANIFKGFLEGIEKSEDKLISLEEMGADQAESSLRNGTITGIFYVDSEPELMVTGNGIEESVLEALLEGYNSQLSIIQTVAKEKPERLDQVLKEIMRTATGIEYVNEVSLGGKKANSMIQYFFSLIAMTCMFGCLLGVDVASQLQANVEAVGVRRSVAPTNKLKMIVSDVIVICGMNFLDVVILIGYMAGVLKLELGNEWGKLFLVSFLGCLIGVSIGILVGSIGTWKESIKIGVILGISLFSSFLSGLMVSGIKGVIEEYCPIINRINPASLITDAIYSISIYNDPVRYTKNIVIMLILSTIFIVSSFLMVRRVRYDSI